MVLEIRRRKAERGSALIIVLITVFFLGAIWMVGLTRTGEEFSQVGAKQASVARLYAAEQALVTAYERPSTWLTDTFLQDAAADIARASITTPVADPGTGKVLAQLTIRPIQNIDAAAAQSNRLPAQVHATAPPVDSGYGLNKFAVRRFGVSAATPDGRTEVHSGVWIVLNK